MYKIHQMLQKYKLIRIKEKAVTEDLEKIRREGAKAAYAGCL